MLGILLATMLGSMDMKPLDYDFNYSQVEEVSTQEVEQPLYEWWASWYDYKLWSNWWSKTHDTCALRIYERYKYYKVCVEDNCITCYQNDYGPQREDRVIDLSSQAFKQLAPLRKWIIRVKVYLVK